MGKVGQGYPRPGVALRTTHRNGIGGWVPGIGRMKSVFQLTQSLALKKTNGKRVLMRPPWVFYNDHDLI
jgi:hypothetical protein